MSYISNALRKLQEDKKSPYAAYEHIVSAPGKTSKRSHKRLSIIAISVVFFCAIVMIVLFYGKEDKKSQVRQEVNAPSARPSAFEASPAELSVLAAPRPNKIVDSRQLKTTAKVRSAQELVESKALYAQALQRHREGNLDEAKILYRKAVELDPYNVQAVNNLGVIYMGEKKFKRAMMRFNNAIDIKHDYVDAHYNLACLYAKNNDTSKSLLYLKKAIAFNPEARQWAKNDGDLETLIHLPEFKKLMEKQ